MVHASAQLSVVTGLLKLLIYLKKNVALFLHNYTVEWGKL